MSASVKRGLESLIAVTGLSPTKQKARLQELQEQFQKDMAAEEAAMDTSTEAGSSPGASSPRSGKGSGKGRNKNRGGRGVQNQAPKNKLGSGDEKTRLTTIEKILMMLMRMVCSHANEFRRQARETQNCLKFKPKSVAPVAMAAGHEKWKGECKKEEGMNFPVHPEGPLRYYTFRKLWKTAQENTDAQHITADPNIGEALANLQDMNNIKKAVQRFYKMREGNPEGEDGSDAAKEMWILRLAPNQTGQKMENAIKYLEQDDITATVLDLEMHPDRAPKSGLQKGLEETLDLNNSKKKS